MLTGERIDLDKKPFSKLPINDSRYCMGPSGGHLPFSNIVSAAHTISFILTRCTTTMLALHAGMYKSLLELFRTALEAPSAQFVVYDDASDHIPLRVIAALHMMKEKFGANVVFLRGNSTLGSSRAVHAAIEASTGEYIVLVSADT
jgi:hypothetical protein